ncbi:MAG: VUT family protein [Gammaproteobacteria bacterium]|nr:VUT family protein [Gammaproteobacteria bacterium]
MNLKSNVFVGYYSSIIALFSAAAVTSDKIIVYQDYFCDHVSIIMLIMALLIKVSKLIFGLEATKKAAKISCFCVIINFTILFFLLNTATPDNKDAQLYYHSYQEIYNFNKITTVLFIGFLIIFLNVKTASINSYLFLTTLYILTLIISFVINNFNEINLRDFYNYFIINILCFMFFLVILYGVNYIVKNYDLNLSALKTSVANISQAYLLMTLLAVMLLINSHSICYKIISFHSFGLGAIAGSGVVFPVTFLLSDAVAEHYGYTASRTLIWSTLLAQLIFVFCVYIIYLAPYASTWQNQGYFVNLFSNFFPRQILAASICVFFSFFIFTFLITVLKANLQNKKFWYRTLIANMVANAVLCCLSYFILYYGKYTMSFIIKIIMSTWVIKMIIACIGTFMLTIPLIYYLKLYDNKILFSKINVLSK